jgi:hypothetical protein
MNKFAISRAIFACVICTLGFACVARTPVSSSWQDGSRVSLTGWLQRAGEYRLYFHRRDLGALYTGKCLSGSVLLGEVSDRAQRLLGRRVVVDAILREYANFDSGDATTGFVVRDVQNYCGSRFIFHAFNVREAPR